MKNITILSDYIQLAEKSHRLEREQIVDLLDSENPEILRQLCVAAEKCQRQFLGREIFLINRWTIGNYALNKEVIENFIENSDALYFTQIMVQRNQDSKEQMQTWLNLANICKRRKLQLIVGFDRYGLDDIELLHQNGVYSCRLWMGTFNYRIYRQLNSAGKAVNFNYALKCLEKIGDICGEATTGFMVGIPQTTTSDIAGDILEIQRLQPKNIEIARYDTTVDFSLLFKTIAIARLLNPKLGIAATANGQKDDETLISEKLPSGANLLAENFTSPEIIKDIHDYLKLKGFEICKDFKKLF